MKKRDFNIVLHLKGEISLKTKVIKDKKKFNRKIKHKKSSL